MSLVNGDHCQPASTEFIRRKRTMLLNDRDEGLEQCDLGVGFQIDDQQLGMAVRFEQTDGVGPRKMFIFDLGELPTVHADREIDLLHHLLF